MRGGGASRAAAGVGAYNGVRRGTGAGLGGGGAYVSGYSSAEFVNDIFSGNAAGEVGAGGAVHDAILGENSSTFSHCDFWDNSDVDYAGGDADLWSGGGNLALEPVFLDVSADDPWLWDLHLVAGSPLQDAGDGGVPDPDGWASDLGAFGGSFAADWDLDGDDYPDWWKPGPYVDAYQADGLDCDDRDATVYPYHGCEGR